MSDRPFYINHPRTEPVDGDVARDMLRGKRALYIFTEDDDSPWWLNTAGDWLDPIDFPVGRSLRLLVDGETGEVVK